MKIIFVTLKGEKEKIKAIGKIFDLMVLLIAISKGLSKKISKEKEVCLEEAEKLIIDCN